MTEITTDESATGARTPFTVVMPAFAHDPLRESGEHHNQHETAQREKSAEKPDLSEVRSLLMAFRKTGDDRNLEEAWKLLMPVLDSSTDDPEILIAAAFVAQSRHKFTHALQLITKAQSINPNNDEGWLLLASIHLVRGETMPASRACGQLRAAPLLTTEEV